MRSANVFLPDFSHIYVEKGALEFPLTKRLLDRFSASVRVPILDYKKVFNRGRQNFQIQKQSMKLILAVKQPPFLYPITEIQPSAGYQNHFYATPLINCLYNCDYCFLQGMYPSGNMVLFVNENDFFSAIVERLEYGHSSNNPLVISPSYNTDLMAIEKLVPLTRSWINFCYKTENLVLEFRTKSALFRPLEDITPIPTILFAWTLSPKRVIDTHEFGTPNLNRRLKAALGAIKRGWRVRLCFDPVLFYDGWEQDYAVFLDQVFTTLPADRIEDATLGYFRMNKDFFQRIRKQNPKSPLYYQSYELHNDVISLSLEKQKLMHTYLEKVLIKYLPVEKLLFWN